jgi:hypothetical protein
MKRTRCSHPEFVHGFDQLRSRHATSLSGNRSGSILIGVVIALVMVVVAYFVYDSMIQAAREAGKKDISKGGGKAMKKFVEGDMQGMSDAIGEEAQQKELMLAVSENRLEDVQALLGPDMDLNRRNTSGSTLLHQAAVNDSLPIARLLIEHKATLTIADKNGSVPLHVALSRRPVNPKMVELLLKADLSTINTADKGGMTPLHLAVQSGSAESVKILLGFGADVSLRNQAKQTPLALARAANDSKIAELLTGAGATK